MKTKPLLPQQAVTANGLLPSRDLVEIIDRLHRASGVSGGSLAWGDITGKPVFATVATTGAYGDLTGLPITFSGSYGDLTGVPATFPPSSHSHIIADVTGLQAALDGKEAAFLSGAATITVPNARYEHEQAVSVVGIVPGNRIAAWLAPGVDSDENTADLLDIRSLAATAGTDQITFAASFGERTSGPISILWSVV